MFHAEVALEKELSDWNNLFAWVTEEEKSTSEESGQRSHDADHPAQNLRGQS